MVLINLIANIFKSTYSFSADPNLFGSKKRISAKSDLADEFKASADQTQKEIDITRTQNPFESASSKSAMAKSSRNAKQMQTRMLNTMGANASPEAMISAQGNTTQALGATAGSIAVGSEANKLSQINALKGQQTNQMNAYGTMKDSSINEIGSGWTSLFDSLSSIGSMASGVGQAAKLFI